MKRTFAHISAFVLMLSLLAGCSQQEASAAPSPAAPGETAASAAMTPETQTEQEAAPSAETAAEETDPESAVSITADPNAYPDPDDDDYLNALVYADNSSDRIVQVTIQCQAFDTDGNLMSAYDPFRGISIEKYRTDLFVPAGADHLPMGFTLPMGFRYDISTDTVMPEIGHLEFEVLETKTADWEDLKAHFTPGEPEIREHHIYIYVKFDQEIADKYTSLYPDYTLLGYSGDTVTSVSCRNGFPSSNSSVPVAYAIEHNDSSMLVYHWVPDPAPDRWELYLGCIGGE